MFRLAVLARYLEADTRRGSINVITDGKQEARMVNYTNIDEDYFSTLGIRVLEGRNFDSSPGDKGERHNRERGDGAYDGMEKAT